MSKTLIIVPMKDPSASKTRLADALGSRARARLARLLFQRTMAFLKPIAAEVGADLAVVTASHDIAQIAGAQVIEDTANSLSGAVTEAAIWAEARGYARLCVIPADLVAPKAADMRRLLDSAAAVTVCPSTDLGTNALLVSPPTGITFHYGPNSAQRHLRAAEDAVLMPLDSLRFDLDTSACLTRAIRRVPELEVPA